MAFFKRGRPHSFYYGNIVVVAAFIVLFLTFGVQTAFGVFFKPMLSEFGWTKAATSGAYSISWLMAGFLGAIMGRICDRFGARWIITFAGLLIGIGYILMSQISSIWQIYLFLGIIVGFGMSGIWVPIVSTVAHWFSSDRNLMTAIVGVGGGIGSLAAPPLADWLINEFGWRASYLILGIIVFVSVIFLGQFIKRTPIQLNVMTNRSIGDPVPLEKPETIGLSLQEAVHTRQFWLVSAMMFCLGFSAYLLQVHITVHAIEIGLSSTTAANVLATIGGLTVVGRLGLGGAADRLGNKKILIISFFLVAASSLWLLPAKSEWSLYLFAVMLGIGFGGGIVNSSVVAEIFGMRSHGSIFGFNCLTYSIGVALGPFVAGYIYDVTGSYSTAFLVCAASGILGLVLSTILTPIRDRLLNSCTSPIK